MYPPSLPLLPQGLSLSLFASNRNQDVTIAAVDAAYMIRAIDRSREVYNPLESETQSSPWCKAKDILWLLKIPQLSAEKRLFDGDGMKRQHQHPESCARVFTYASLSTYPRTYRFDMAGFDGFCLQCRSAAFAGTRNRHPR